MRLRSRLALILFALAVIPLTGVTVYSYYTSLRAFHRAVEAEQWALADEVGRRLTGVTSDLERRIHKLSDLPYTVVLASDPKERDQFKKLLMTRVREEMGGAAGFVDQFELAPAPPGAPAPPAPVAGEHQRRTPEPPEAGHLRVDTREAKIATTVEVLETGAPAAFTFRMDEPESVVEVAPVPDVSGLDEEKARLLQEKARHLEEVARVTQEVVRRAQEVAARKAATAEEHKKRLGRDFSCTLKAGEAVATLRANVRTGEILRSVLSATESRHDDIVFAVDPDGQIYTAKPEDADAIRAHALVPASTPAGGGQTQRRSEDWVMVSRKDEASGLTLGIARPVAESLKEIRRTAAWNFGLGLGVVGLALLGIGPLSRSMTRKLSQLAEGAEKLAHGDLSVRVPVSGPDEFGRLSETFNRMAEDLQEHQQTLLERERLKRDLEMCRRIQDELLPHVALRCPIAEVKGVSIPAREVGGDFFNYFQLPGGNIAILVGDVSGKGVSAALMMANLQATLRARLPIERDLAALAACLDSEIHATTPPEVYLTLFMGVLDVGGRMLRWVNAGHNPQYVLRGGDGIEALDSTGRPMGLLPGGTYEERAVELHPGDSLFLYTDGLVECENEAGEAFGSERLREALSRERQAGLDVLLAHVEETVRSFRGSVEASDDATLVILRAGPLTPAA
ncbi:MAG: SpoIIE family protein phosphatase [Acidobacteriota bacterium]